MINEEIKKLGYSEYCQFLVKKYGPVPYDYFCNEHCRSTNGAKNSRTKEGLVIHHMDEDQAIMLSTSKYALNNPFAFQKAKRLVYCNLIEHLILHIKILENPRPLPRNIVGHGGIINFLVPELNDIYSGWRPNAKNWKTNTTQTVKNLKADYLFWIKHMVQNLGVPFSWLAHSMAAGYPSTGWIEKNNFPLYNEMVKFDKKFMEYFKKGIFFNEKHGMEEYYKKRIAKCNNSAELVRLKRMHEGICDHNVNMEEQRMLYEKKKKSKN